MQKNHVDRGDACGCFSKDPWDGPLTVEMHHTVLSVELRDGFLRYESPYMNRANLYVFPQFPGFAEPRKPKKAMVVIGDVLNP